MNEWLWWDSLEGDDVCNNAWGFPHYDVAAVATFIEDNTDTPTNVLDIGCGPGRLGHELARRHPDAYFYGVDVSEQMITLSLTDSPPNWSAMPTDGYTLPDSVYNVIYAVTVFQHVPPGVVALYLDLAYHHLDAEGTLIFTYAIGDEVAPRSYQTSHDAVLDALESTGFETFERLATPTGHPDWHWARATA